MTIAEECASSEFFKSLRTAMCQGIRIKEIRVKRNSHPEFKFIDDHRWMAEFYGIPVRLIS